MWLLLSRPQGAVVQPLLVQVFRSVWTCQSLAAVSERSQGPSEVLAMACSWKDAHLVPLACHSPQTLMTSTS